MKKNIGYLITGNFYRYNVYKITDGKNNIFYNAEPVGAGVTRVAETLEKLKQILDHDVWALNHIWTK